MKRLERFIDARNTAEGKAVSILLSILLVFMIFNASAFVSHDGAYAATPDAQQTEETIEAPATDAAEVEAPEAEDEVEKGQAPATETEQPEAPEAGEPEAETPEVPEIEQPEATEPEAETPEAAAPETIEPEAEATPEATPEDDAATKPAPRKAKKAAKAAWQTPTSVQTITAKIWCTNTYLGSNGFTTANLEALGSKNGMNVAAFAAESVSGKGGGTYTFHHAQAQPSSQQQTTGSNDNKYDATKAVDSLRYNQSKTTWEYKLANGTSWSSMNGMQLVFYYHYDQSIGSDGNVILKSKDWPYTETEWLQGWRYVEENGKKVKEGINPSNPACAIYQLYSADGKKFGEQIRTYYYSPNLDKLNNSLSIAEHWDIEEVRIMPVSGKPVNKVAFKYTSPADLSSVSGSSVQNVDSFTIPWQSAWNKQKNVCFIAVKIKAEVNQSPLKVNYLDAQNADIQVQDSLPVNVTVSGEAAPSWSKYVTCANNKVVANNGYIHSEKSKEEAALIPTNIGAEYKTTIDFYLPQNTPGYNRVPVDAQIDGNNLNLYFAPQSYTVTYTDGVEGEEVFADQSSEVLYNRATPAFEGEAPARTGYAFAGWDPAVAETVTGDATYTAKWDKLYTVTYDLNGGTAPEGTQLVHGGLLAGAETPAIAKPARENYVFARWSPAVAAKVTGDATYTAQWDEDIIGNPDDPEKKGPDGIADKYQQLVTFKVANGSWNTGGKDNVVEVLTFYKDGELSTAADATAAMVAAPAVGEAPDAGYYNGYDANCWNAAIPTGDVVRTAVAAAYTYTYPAAYTVTYADGVDGAVFVGQITTNLLAGASTPAFEGETPARTGYVFAGWDKEIASQVAGNVTYTAQWDEDVIGNDPENPGTTDYSDGIADKYQTIVVYAGVGGTVGGKLQYEHVVTLQKDGKNAVDGTYTLTSADVPATAAAEGYAGNPAWSSENPVGVEVDKQGAAFIANWGNGFIAYYYDDVLANAVDAEKGVGEAITFDADDEANKKVVYEEQNYVLDGVENNGVKVAAGDPGKNVVNVYYALDAIGNDPENPGVIDQPDGIADKYQVVVTYAAVNGTIDGAAKVVLNKYDAEGEFAKDGSATLAAEQIPAASAAEGFQAQGAWTPEAPAAGMRIAQDTDFVITFAPVAVPDPEDPTEPVNPPTDPTDPTDPTEPTTPTDPTEPVNPPTDDPLVPGPTTPTTPGTPGGGTPAAPAGGPGAAAAPAAPAGPAAAAATATIGDDANPLADAGAEEAIADDENPLGAFDEPHCWVHWLMVLGGLLTIAYGAAVLFGRRRDIHDMDDFEDQVLGREERAREGARAPRAGYQAI